MLTQPPTVSIVIPLFNREELVTETLASVQAQTYPYWEAMVVDDGSTDDSYAVVARMAEQDKRIKLLSRNREPKGAPTCRNIGIDRASGQYVIFLDSDDLMAPFCLEQRVAVMEERTDLDFAAFNLLLFRKEPSDMNMLWNVDSKESDLVRFLRADGVWSGTGTIYRISTIKKNCSFSGETKFWKEDMPFWQDLELHIRIVVQCWKYAKYLDSPPDCYIRQHDDGMSISRHGLNRLEKYWQRMDIYRYLVAQVGEYRTLTRNERYAVVAFLFNSARYLVFRHHDLAKAKKIWTYASQQGQLSPLTFWIGKAHLVLLNRSHSDSLFRRLHAFGARGVAFFLPGKYKHHLLTLGRIPLLDKPR